MLLDNLLLHPLTKTSLLRFSQRPPHFLMISGGRGSGKLHLAENLAAHWLELKSVENLRNYPYYQHVQKEPGSQDISIDMVRQLIKSLKLKIPVQTSVKRVVAIEEAQLLSLEAQNALLKILEEPNPGTSFIMTTPSQTALLPTIVSRAQHLEINSPTLQAAKQFYGAKYSSTLLDSAWQLSQGRAGLMQALLEKDSEHYLKNSISSAKVFLKKDVYGRLLQLEELVKDKANFANFLEALNRLLTVLHHQAILKKRPGQLLKLMASRRAVNKMQLALEENVQIRLIALHLILNLKL